MRDRIARFLLGVAFLVGSIGCDRSEEKLVADLVLRGGKIVTLDASNPEVEALAARGDRILALGSNAAIDPLVGESTVTIDLEGKLAIPGFIEGHGHLRNLGVARISLNLTGAENWDAVVEQVRVAVLERAAGEWILGRGWHQDKWSEPPSQATEGFPGHHALSAVSPDNPVILTHASGHATFGNARAMELASVDRTTPDPPGGEIVRDRKGNPIGVFRERASDILRRGLRESSSKQTPEQRDNQARKEIELAMQECLSKGITSFQDAGSRFSTIDLFRRMAQEGSLPLRLWVMIGGEPNEQLAAKLAHYKILNLGDHRLTVRSIKRSIDGALGSRGAWLLKPYRDSPSSVGFNTMAIEELEKTARLALENGFQLCVHAIGDRGNRETLNIFERAFVAQPDSRALRWRIEHAQHLSAKDIPRFFELGVIASMQGIHCTSDAPFVVARLGEQRAEEGAYAWRQLLESGAIVTNGTDAPVEDVDPIASYYASVTRRLPDGSVFFADQRMTRMEALKSYTLDSAFAAFEEELKGSLIPGKLADLTVLSQDILTISEHRIPRTQVLYTIVGGEIAYRR